MVKVEKDGKKNRERYGDKDIPYTDVPKMHKPASINCWVESSACWQGGEIDIAHLAYVHETCEEDDCKWRTIVLDEHSNVVLEKRTTTDDTT